MKKFVPGVLLLMSIFATSVVWSGEPQPDYLNRLMTLSGLHKQVAEIPGMVRAGAEQARQRGTPIPDALFAELTSSIEESFQPSEIISIIGEEVKKNISEEEAKDLLAWYESDLGKKITKAEEDASTPAAYQEMLSETPSLLADEKRVEIAKKLESLLNATDMAMQLQEDAGIAVLTAFSKARNPEQPVPVEEFKSQMLAQEPQMRTNIKQQVLLSYVYSYKNIDMESLNRYVEFNERPITKRFNDSVMNGMKDAFSKANNKMAASLAGKIKKSSEER